MTRNLTNVERMFVNFNKDLYGQNCPLIGASISFIQSSMTTNSSSPPSFAVSDLESRARTAFAQTRWRYPTIAARVDDSGLKAEYPIETSEQVNQWMERTVRMVVDEGGWIAVRERVSKDLPIPSDDGDFCVMYIITRPEDEVEGVGMKGFDVLMHTHHVFTDGSGIRSILNEFLERLASPSGAEMQWGGEVERLFPPACVLVKDEENDDGAGSGDEDQAPKIGGVGGMRLKGFGVCFFLHLQMFLAHATYRLQIDELTKRQPDIGLPVHTPDIGPPTALLRGTKISPHTFTSPTFLPQLLSAGRTHNIKLTSLLHAALLLAVHQSQPSDFVPSEEDRYKSGSALDMRNGWLKAPFDERKVYVNSAIAIHPIEVPCRIFDRKGGFWEAAQYITNLWDEHRNIKGMAETVERDAGTFIGSWGSRKTVTPLAKPRTCPYYVSDPPGEQLFNQSFAVEGSGGGLEFVIDSYQLATDQNQAVV